MLAKEFTDQELLIYTKLKETLSNAGYELAVVLGDFRSVFGWCDELIEFRCIVLDDCIAVFVRYKYRILASRLPYVSLVVAQKSLFNTHWALDINDGSLGMNKIISQAHSDEIDCKDIVNTIEEYSLMLKELAFFWKSVCGDDEDYGKIPEYYGLLLESLEIEPHSNARGLSQFRHES